MKCTSKYGIRVVNGSAEKTAQNQIKTERSKSEERPNEEYQRNTKTMNNK